MGGHNYPGMHGSYGNVFASDSEEEIKKASGKGCYATFCNENGNKKDFSEIWSTIKQWRELRRKNRKNLNKFLVNVADTFAPTSVKSYCRG